MGGFWLQESWKEEDIQLVRGHKQWDDLSYQLAICASNIRTVKLLEFLHITPTAFSVDVLSDDTVHYHVIMASWKGLAKLF